MNCFLKLAAFKKVQRTANALIVRTKSPFQKLMSLIIHAVTPVQQCEERMTLFLTKNATLHSNVYYFKTIANQKIGSRQRLLGKLSS